MSNPEEIIKFWFETLTPEDHFRGGEQVDEQVRSRFHDVWLRAAGGAMAEWEKTPRGALALIICLDQFPRNMFRNSGQSFHSDALAREIASRSIEKRYDWQLEEKLRLFLYMPFMHSESLLDQDRSVDLIAGRMPQVGRQNLLHAHAHRKIIEMFGRFPFRNEALGRKNSLQENEFLNSGGYTKVVDQISSESTI